jgi:hypothetical protein
MGLKQTNLSKKEEKVFDAVKDFLFKQKILPSDTPYVMIKYCIANVCKQTVDILKKNSLGIDAIGLTEEDFEGIFKLRSRKKDE